MIIISENDLEKILAHSENERPCEACGLMGGEIRGSCRIIKRVYLLTNTDASAVHFSLDPKEQLAAVRDIRERGFVPLGNWHSHPETPAFPSEEDKRLAYDSNASYMILSLADRESPVLNSFVISGKEPPSFEQEELVVMKKSP